MEVKLARDRQEDGDSLACLCSTEEEREGGEGLELQNCKHESA